VAVISFDATNRFVQSYVWTSANKALLPGLGGNFVEATALNDGGFVTGAASDSTDTNFQAAVWVPQSHAAIPLGTVGGDTGSIGLAINNHGVVVGGSGSVTVSAAASYAHAFIWREGRMYDLNTLVPAGAPLTLNVAYAITDGGIVAGLGTNAGGETHAFVLMP
jgi:probable HAF family extracellular repeat protein